MNLHLTYPWALWGLALATIPLLSHGVPVYAHPQLSDWPVDHAADWLQRGLRLAAATCIALLVVAAAAPYADGGTIAHIGEGAEIVVVFDRSGSMTEPLMGNAIAENEVNDPGGVGDRQAGATETKIAAARRVLLRFMGARPGDTFGLVVFNAAPIAVAPLSEDRMLAEAALEAAQSRSTGFTGLGRALGLGLDYFRGRPFTAARVVLLVSDGGAVIREEDRARLKRMFATQRASLIWLYARGVHEPSVLAPTAGQVSESMQMHRFFSDLGMGYRVFEVTSGEGLEQAVAEVGKLTSLPTRYEERLPRRDLAGPLYIAALGCLALLIGARLMEVQAWVV